jgi:hypothetical protein
MLGEVIYIPSHLLYVRGSPILFRSMAEIKGASRGARPPKYLKKKKKKKKKSNFLKKIILKKKNNPKIRCSYNNAPTRLQTPTN